MQSRLRITFKLALILICIFFLIFLIRRDTRKFRMEQPEGEAVSVEDVIILMNAFHKEAVYNKETADRMEEWLLKLIRKNSEEGGGGILLYQDYLELITLLSQEEQFSMDKKYNGEYYFLKDDWYDAYDRLLSLYGMGDKIFVKDVEILERAWNLTAQGTEGAEGAQRAEVQALFLSDGRSVGYASSAFEDCFYSKARAYVEEDGNFLLTVRERRRDAFTLENIWIMEADEESFRYFVHGSELTYRWQDEKLQDGKLQGEEFQEGTIKEGITRESIADLTFAEGRLKKADLKEDRVSGRLLRMDGKELELQGKGTYTVKENCKVYQLYEELREAALSDLRIGYDFADYVLENNKICGVLIMRKENMENIRVAVMDSGFQSLYHDSISFSADCEMELVYGPYENREKKALSKGERITIEKGSEYLKGDRVELIPSLQSGRIQVFSIERSQGTPSYRGRMEIVATEEGLALINELLLEEYLYSVVPSEMPASYAMEALKAQAICARTYAYRYLIHPRLSDIGAHVGDSANYQVYNNIAENVNSTKAVKETTGMLLYYGDEAVSTYYYSTSCGFGTDAGIWKEENKETFPYLSSIHIASQEKGTDEGSAGNVTEVRDEEREMHGRDKGMITPKQMTEEKMFREYILTAHEEDYEKEESWYRWEYSVEELNLGEMKSRLKEAFHEIYDISIVKRREGGAADKLLVETDAGSFEVSGEYQIRHVLNNGGKIKKQDGSESELSGILPSAYFVIDVVKDNGIVVGYTIFGGGYGHGVGMSQNGAKAMGNEGKSSEEILSFFYPGCQMRKMY